MKRTVAIAVVILLLGQCFGCDQVPFGADAPTKRPIAFIAGDAANNGAVITGGLLELDDLDQGGRASKTFFIRNLSRSAISVKQAASSCECVTFVGLPTEIARGAAVHVCLQVNLEQEESFVGEMDVEVSLSVHQSSGADLGSVPLRIRFRVLPQVRSATQLVTSLKRSTTSAQYN